jgi:hypothetical protein
MVDLALILIVTAVAAVIAAGILGVRDWGRRRRAA